MKGGITVDGYELPNGEFRIGITGASVALGYAKNWLGRAIERGGNTVKALQGKGFGGSTKQVVTQSIRGGGSFAETISIPDFIVLIEYAAVTAQKPEAIALMSGATQIFVENRFRDAFGVSRLTKAEENFMMSSRNGLYITQEQSDRYDEIEQLNELATGRDRKWWDVF